jgi:hypothetical protein
VTARHRGDTRIHSRWRPAPPAVPSTVAEPEPDERPQDEPAESELLDQPHARPRRWRATILLAVVVGVGAIAGSQHAGGTRRAALPATPEQWVQRWTAASLDDPGRVCGQLFAPALAAAFKPDTGRSCTAYYGNVKSSPFRVRHILQDGAAAAIEARQVSAGHNWGYFTILLSHRDHGWQAIDIVPGGPVRPR